MIVNTTWSLGKKVPALAQTSFSLFLLFVHALAYTHRKCNYIKKLGLNNKWTENFQMFKLDLEKGEEPEIKLATSVES